MHLAPCASFQGLLQDPAPNLSDCQCRYEQIPVRLFRHPRDQVFRWHWFCDIADDIGIEEALPQRSTLRPWVIGRSTSKSAPTKGDRRNAARTPPFFGGLRRNGPTDRGLNQCRIRIVSGQSLCQGPDQVTISIKSQDLEPSQSLACEGASGSYSELVFWGWCSKGISFSYIRLLSLENVVGG
jgi:hypothetical protein